MKGAQRNLTTGALIGVLGIAVATAQSPPLDPPLVAPHIFETVLDNSRVRVLKVAERNGETSPLHAHPGRVIVYLSPCAWMEEAADGERQMESYRLGEVTWRNPTTHGGNTSKVVQDCSYLEIEIK